MSARDKTSNVISFEDYKKKRDARNESLSPKGKPNKTDDKKAEAKKNGRGKKSKIAMLGTSDAYDVSNKARASKNADGTDVPTKKTSSPKKRAASKKSKSTSREKISNIKSIPNPFSCRLVWLFCPTCQTFEYSHVLAPHGRSHKCGTQIIEKNIDLDGRFEITLARKNIAVLKQRADLLDENFAKLSALYKKLDRRDDSDKNKKQPKNATYADLPPKSDIDLQYEQKKMELRGMVETQEKYIQRIFTALGKDCIVESYDNKDFERFLNDGRAQIEFDGFLLSAFFQNPKRHFDTSVFDKKTTGDKPPKPGRSK